MVAIRHNDSREEHTHMLNHKVQVKLRVVLAMVVLGSLTACGTNGLFDRDSDRRKAFMAKELVYTQRPEGALPGGWGGPTSARTGDSPLASTSAAGGILAFWMKPDTDIDDIADFYVALLAKQGHRNISIICNDRPLNRYLDIVALAWDGKVGYLIAVNVRHSPPIAEYREAKHTDPFFVQIEVIGNKNMVHPTEEDPANYCPTYSMDRYRNALYPFGLTPFRAAESWRRIHTFDGSKETYRKFGPVQVTPRFTPTTIEQTTTTTP